MPALRRKTRVKNLKPIDAVYIAAFIDCDGSFGRYKNGKGYYHKVVNLFNNNKKVLDWVNGVVGCGNVKIKIKKIKNPKHKTQYLWGLYSEIDIIRLFKQVRPYMKIKKEKAKEMLKPNNSL